MPPHQQGDAEQHRGHLLQQWLSNNICWAGGSNGKQAKTVQWGFWGFVSNSQWVLQGRYKLQVTVVVRDLHPHFQEPVFLPCPATGGMEQLYHSLPFQDPLLHPVWQAMPGAASWDTKVSFLWPCHGGTEHPSHMASALRRFGLGEAGGIICGCNCAGRLESSTLQWCPCQPSGLSQPIPTLSCHLLWCPCTSHLQDLTLNKAAPTPCPYYFPRNGNDLMFMAILFRMGRGDGGIRGHYCLNTFILPFFSESLNHELSYTERSNWQL